MRLSFRPPPWAWLATLSLLALLLGLGSWQLRRAHDKEVLLADYARAARQPPLALRGDSPAPDTAAVAASAQGTYLADRQMLLDNQSSRGRPGYQVWTPMRLAAGGLILVDRGWIGLNRDPRILPQPAAPQGEAAVRGLWRALPRPGLRLAHPQIRSGQAFPAVVEYPTPADVATLLDEPVAPGVLLLAPDQPGGFVRDWNPGGEFPPARHYGYAVQWFALALTLLVIFVRMNLKRLP